MKKEQMFTLFLTLLMVAWATAVHASTGAGVAAWEGMGNTALSIQGVPAFAVGSIAMVASGAALMFGDLGYGAQICARGVGGTGLACNGAAFLNAMGVSGALS